MQTDQGDPLRLTALPAERLQGLFSIMEMLDHYPPVTKARSLRALGFNATSVVTSVLAESLLLGLVGGLPAALRAARQPIPMALRVL